MSDDVDRAQEREEEFRGDAMNEQARRTAQSRESESSLTCRVCDMEIPEQRRAAVPGVQTCIDCQRELESALFSHKKGG